MDNSNNENKDIQATKKEPKSNKIAVAKSISADSLSNINLLNEEEMTAARAVLGSLIKTDKGGIKTVEEGVAMLVRAKSLNIPFGAALEHIHVINGKTGVDVHIVKALLLRAGCSWNCTKDYQPLYEYTDGINVFNDGTLPEYVVRCNNVTEAKAKREKDVNGDKMYVYPVKYYKDFNGNIYKDYQLSENKFGKVTTKQEAIDVQKAGKIPVYMVPALPIDYITEYEFHRQINGEVMKAIGRFSYSEANTAGLFSKDTYKNYPRIMISHRAFMYGARDIASDAIMGCYETKELKLIENVNISETEFIDAEVV